MTSSSEPATRRTLSFDHSIHLWAQLKPLRRGAGDPTWQTVGTDAILRASRTPEGIGAELLRPTSDGGVEQLTWGPGAQWLADRLPRLLGGQDDVADFQEPPPFRAVARRYAGLRVGRTDAVAEAVAAAVLEQKVTGKEAWMGWRYLVKQFGEPIDVMGRQLYAPPAPDTWGAIPSWHWHRASVDSKRAGALMRVMREIPEFSSAADSRALSERMRAVRGIGEWTVAEVCQRAVGDADAISVGDYHLAKEMVYAFTGRRDGTDPEMLEILQPYVGHRFRVQRLLELSGHRRPRRGPRMSYADMRDF